MLTELQLARFSSSFVLASKRVAKKMNIKKQNKQKNPESIPSFLLAYSLHSLICICWNPDIKGNLQAASCTYKSNPAGTTAVPYNSTLIEHLNDQRYRKNKVTFSILKSLLESCPRLVAVKDRGKNDQDKTTGYVSNIFVYNISSSMWR